MGLRISALGGDANNLSQEVFRRKRSEGVWLEVGQDLEALRGMERGPLM